MQGPGSDPQPCINCVVVYAYCSLAAVRMNRTIQQALTLEVLWGGREKGELERHKGYLSASSEEQREREGGPDRLCF